MAMNFDRSQGEKKERGEREKSVANRADVPSGGRSAGLLSFIALVVFLCLYAGLLAMMPIAGFKCKVVNALCL